MMPVAPLMIEHRVIERMVRLLRKPLEADNAVDPAFVDEVVDFMRSYADRTHHGKEEDILFKKLEAKGITGDLERTMRELIEEHKIARAGVRELAQLNLSLAQGDRSVLPRMREVLGILAELYPRHIEREDKHFFLPAMQLLTQEEKDKMLADFAEFDRQMIHEKYRGVVESWEAKWI